MDKYSPTLTDHDEFLDVFKFPAGIVAGAVTMLGTFNVAVDHTPQGERFRERQELSYQVNDLERQQASLHATLDLLPTSSALSRDEISSLIETKSVQIAEVSAQKDDIGNVYIDNTELIASSLLVGALVATAVFKRIDSKVHRRSPDYKPY